MRQMKAANVDIFSKLENYATQRTPDRTIRPGRRHIRTNAAEKKWLQQLKVREKQRIVGNLQAATLSFEEKQYFAFVGWEDSPLLEREALIQYDLNSGIVSALLSELSVPVRQTADANQITEHIFHQLDDDDGKPETLNEWAYDFIAVKHFFEPILFYEIPKGSPLWHGECSRIAGYHICRDPDHLGLPFSKQTLGVFEKAFVEGGSAIPYENLLVALTSVHWKYSFLDVYRCIERIFPVCLLDDLHGISETPLPLLSFAVAMEERIGWRPKEDVALNRLVDAAFIPSLAVALLREVKQHLDNNADGELGLRVYRIRNSIVHHRPATAVLRLNDDHWNKLISAVLLIVIHWYDEYGSKLNPLITLGTS